MAQLPPPCTGGEKPSARLVHPSFTARPVFKLSSAAFASRNASAPSRKLVSGVCFAAMLSTK